MGNLNNKPGKACLVLTDGTVFDGYSCGAEGETSGEVVFNTSMTGYQEILTDPSYRGQIVAMTYTQIGNYGVNSRDIESRRPMSEGFIVKECIDYPSNWRSEMSIVSYFRKHGIVCIEGIDTRALTKHLRDFGVQAGIISTTDLNPESLLGKIRRHPDISTVDLVRHVTTDTPYTWSELTWQCEHRVTPQGEKKGSSLHPLNRKKVVVYDFGVKMNILRHLAAVGFDITVVPADTEAEEVLRKADGIVLSNGPGDPCSVPYAVETAKRVIGRKPVLGICLGHQILGLALGGRTYKLKFGHHGGNHPVMDLSNGKVEITSQNHNYCVDMESLGDEVMLTHKNLYDGTEEGIRHREMPIMSIQYHPEAGPGPNDSGYIFMRFKEMVDQWRE